MKILIRFCLILLITCLTIGVSTSCSDDNDCSLAGRAMMNCALFTIDPETKAQLNDTLDSLTVTAMGTQEQRQIAGQIVVYLALARFPRDERDQPRAEQIHVSRHSESSSLAGSM